MSDYFSTIDIAGTGTIEHFLYCGDNIDILPIITKEYDGKIDLISIDPPYNTGKKVGKYNDNFSSHEKWLDFMEPRLKMAKNLLSTSGLIFINIGETEEAHLKILCNNIFGEKNKVSSIIWQSKYTVANDKFGISSQIEYILVYAKDIKNISINNDPLREEYVKSTYRNIDADIRGPWRSVQLYKKKNPKSYTVESPTGKKWTMPWNYSQERWQSVLEKENLIYWGQDGNSCPVKKVFLKNTKGIAIKNLWLGEEVGFTADGGETLENMFNNRNQFLYPKPVSLLKRILKIASKKDSVVMDFFAGSGTFGHAVLEYNKESNANIKFILITNNENNICDDITFPRLKKVTEGYIDKNNKEFLSCEGRVNFIKFNKK